jgi:hypothetical protein
MYVLKNIVAENPLEQQAPQLGMTNSIYQDLLDNVPVHINGMLFSIVELMSRTASVVIYQVLSEGSNYILRVEQSNVVEKMNATNQLAGYIGNNLQLGPRVYGTSVVSSVEGPFFSFILMEKGMHVDQYCMGVGDSRGCKLRFVEEMHEILQILMRQGIFCVDIKPDNSLVHISGPKEGRLMLIDFGMDWCLTTNPEAISLVVTNALIAIMTLQYATLMAVPINGPLLTGLCQMFEQKEILALFDQPQSELMHRILQVVKHYLNQDSIRQMIAQVCNAPRIPPAAPARRKCHFG